MSKLIRIGLCVLLCCICVDIKAQNIPIRKTIPKINIPIRPMSQVETIPFYRSWSPLWNVRIGCWGSGIAYKDTGTSLYELGEYWWKNIDFIDGMKVLYPIKIPKCSVDYIANIRYGMPCEIGDISLDNETEMFY